MKWVLLAILLFILLVIIIFITKVKIFLDYFHGNDNDHLKVTVKAWGGLLKYEVEIPVIKIDDNSPTLIAEKKIQTGPGETKEKTSQMDKNDFLTSLSDFRHLLAHIVGFHKIVRGLLAKVTVRNVEWHTMVGVGDAAATGVLTGAFWAVKGGIIGIISSYMKLKEMPVMSITPSFQHAVSITSFKCMFQVRVGHAILAGIKMVKYWKGGWPEFKTKPLNALSGDKTNTV